MKIIKIYTIDVRDDGGHLFICVKTEPEYVGEVEGFSYNQPSKYNPELGGNYSHIVKSLNDLIKHVQTFIDLKNKEDSK